MQCTFEHLTGSRKGQIEHLDGDRIAVGRNPTNALHFDPQVDLDVSGDHAQLNVGDDGRFVLTDLGSKNGTFLNGQKIAGSVPVEPGSKIQFGKNGPEVKVAYTPGPRKAGATRMMLAQVQQDLEAQKAKAAEASKKTTLVLAVSVVAILALGGGGFFWVSAKAKRTNAENALTNANDEQERADGKPVKQYATKEYQVAQEMLDTAKSQVASGDWENGLASANQARKLFLAAEDAAAKNETEAVRKKAEADAQARADAAAAQIAEIQKKAAEDAERAAKELEELKGKPDPTGELLARIKELEARKGESEKVKAVVAANGGSICFIHVESYIQPDPKAARTKIYELDGTGFVVAGNRIVTAKHIAQPHKYDAKLLASAKKYKDERKLDVKSWFIVWAQKGDGAEAKFEKIFEGDQEGHLTVAEDKMEATERETEIEWNTLPLKLKVAVHEAGTNDLAVLHDLGADTLKPVETAPLSSITKLDPLVVLGAASDPKNTSKITPIRADAQDVGETLMLTVPLPPNFAGAAVFSLDGKCVGIVCANQDGNITCLPAERAAKLGLPPAP